MSELTDLWQQRIEAALKVNVNVRAEPLARRCIADAEREYGDLRTAVIDYLVDRIESQRRGLIRTREIDAIRRTEPRSTAPPTHWAFQEAAAPMWADLRASVERYAAEVRLELIDSLLDAEFAVDGERVTWGAATIEQHERRASWLETHASGTLETAARHRAAIMMLREAQLATLRELQRVAA